MSDRNKEEQDISSIVFPEGRVINCALFEKDKYDDKATAQYKIEMAFEPDDLIEAEDKIVDFIVKEYGPSAEDEYNNFKIVGPIIEGDELAKRREEKGKAGDAYKGKLVIRANTQFNKMGQNAPGGIAVYSPDVSAIEPVDQAKVYSGCYGIMVGTIKGYKTNKGEKAVKIYLSAFQKTRDGELLAAHSDYSKVFTPVAGAAPSGESVRKRRSRGDVPF